MATTIKCRTIKKHEKPRPPKLNQRLSTIEGMGSIVNMEDLVSLVDSIASNLSNGIHTNTFQEDIITMCNTLKHCAHQFESVYKDQLDRAFVAIRNGSQDERLDLLTRIHLLELIELRAKQWRQSDSMDAYYTSKLADLDEPDQTMESNVSGSSPHLGGGGGGTGGGGGEGGTIGSPQATSILNIGEVIKNSGKYNKPTRIPGKNYCKDEVVIRNSDSGKVMGIKGRRVHMIEELSQTVISFQRVNPGAKERLVQITGTSEDKIHYAKDLIKETIHRNASPVRPVGIDKSNSVIGGSSSSLNSSASDESNRLHQHFHHQANTRAALLQHSLSTNDANIGEYKHTVTVGNYSLKITGSNLNLVKNAKLILDEHFSKWNNEDLDQFNSGTEFFAFPEELTNHEIVKSTREVNMESNITIENNPKFKPIKEVENEAYKQSNNNRELTYELLLLCAKGPYAKQVPPNWNRIQKECPNIIRKSTINWFDPDQYRTSFLNAGMKILSFDTDND